VVAVERLRDRAAGDRLHLVRERLELLVPAAEGVGRVDDNFALEPVDLAERVGDRTARNGKQDRIRVRGVAALGTQPRDLVSSFLPAVGETAADVSPADGRDLHGPTD